jgi:superfamily I DNA and/or RNA helicase
MLRQVVSVDVDGASKAAHHRQPTADEFWGKCIGIVTPHRAQRALIIRELEKQFPGEKNLIEGAVDTVERFQGGERHTILVTFGIGDTDVIGGEEAFLMQLERTNVAVSRAMAKCVIVMPKTLAAYIPEDKKAIATAFALKDYIEEFCNVAVDTLLDSGTEKRWAQIRYHR